MYIMGSDTKKEYLYKKRGFILFVLACVAGIAAIIVALTRSKKDKSVPTDPGATDPVPTDPVPTDHRGPGKKRATTNPEGGHDEHWVPEHTAQAKTSTVSLGQNKIKPHSAGNTGLSQGELGPLTQIPLAPAKLAGPPATVLKPVTPVAAPVVTPVAAPVAAPVVTPVVTPVGTLVPSPNSHSTVPRNSPWIPYGSPGWESTLNNVVDGHHWLVKRTPPNGTHAMYVDGVVETFRGKQHTPKLKEGQRQHLGDKRYNVVLLKWNHDASGVIYYHQKHGQTGPGSRSPYVVVSGNGGVWLNFGKWGKNIGFSFSGEPSATMVIYNDDTNIYVLLTVDGGTTWQKGEQAMDDPAIFIAGAHEIYRDHNMQVESVWYGSDSNTLLVGEEALKKFAMGG